MLSLCFATQSFLNYFSAVIHEIDRLYEHDAKYIDIDPALTHADDDFGNLNQYVSSYNTYLYS